MEKLNFEQQSNIENESNIDKLSRKEREHQEMALKKTKQNSKNNNYLKRTVLAALIGIGGGAIINNKYQGSQSDISGEIDIGAKYDTMNLENMISDKASFEGGKIEIPISVGKILHKSIYPKSDFVITFIKQSHPLPYSKKYEKHINDTIEDARKQISELQKYGNNADAKAAIATYKELYKEAVHDKQYKLPILKNPIEIQKNILVILNLLKKQGMEAVGVEGALPGFKIEKRSNADFVYSCSDGEQDKKKIEVCENKKANWYFEQAMPAGVVFKALNIDDVLFVPLENAEYNKLLVQKMEDGLTEGKEYNDVYEKREEFAVKKLINDMKKDHKKFGAMVFGGEHEKSIPKYFDEMKISYVVIEPATYTETKEAQRE